VLAAVMEAREEVEAARGDAALKRLRAANQKKVEEVVDKTRAAFERGRRGGAEGWGGGGGLSVQGTWGLP
jgi:hypothetical protein